MRRVITIGVILVIAMTLVVTPVRADGPIWTQTSDTDFDAGVLSNVDTWTSLGDVKLATQVGDNFTEVDSLTFSAGRKTRSAVIDTANGYAYFGTDDDPGNVVKVRLSDFTEVDSLTFSAGKKTRSAVIDTANGYAYFGTDDDPGKVVKVKLFERLYYSSGTLASQVLDTGVAGARWDALSWDATVEEGVTNITFEVSASDTLFAKDDISPPWTSVGGTSPVTSGLPSGQYMQWRANLLTTDTSQTPVLHDVTINYSHPAPTAVGGEVYLVNKLSLLAPWLSLILILAIGGGIFALRRRRAY